MKGAQLRPHARPGAAAMIAVAALCFVLCLALGAVVRTGRTLAFDQRAHRLVRGLTPTAF